MARKPLSNVDTAWLRMEEPTNLMMISGVMVFGAPIDFERLQATVENGLLCFDRFRQRIAPPSLLSCGFHWEDDPDFDINYHLQQVSLPPPGDQAALQDLASLFASTQLDISRPLWQLHLVEEYGDGCALICRLHHCIGDGHALVHVLLSLTDTQPDAAWPAIQPPTDREQPRPRRRYLRRTRSAIRTTGKAAGKIMRGGMRALTQPSHIGDAAQVGARGTSALSRLLLLLPDPKTPFKGELGVPKRAAWSAPLPLQEVKSTGRKLGGTINDILLTAMTGALRRYLQGRGETVDGLDFRTIVPVNLRQPGTEGELGNEFGLVFLSLPIGIADPAERLRELKRRMDALKDSLEAPVTFGILHTIGGSPEWIQDIVVGIFGTKGTTIMTNVIGPREKLYLAGAPLEGLMFWVPQSGRLGLGISILSYAGQVWLGVLTDGGLVPDPEAIIAEFHSEFEELLAMTEGKERPSSMAEMSAMLDDAIAAIDQILQEQPQPIAPVQEETPSRCQALTKAGAPCKNRPLPNSQFCRVHQAS